MTRGWRWVVHVRDQSPSVFAGEWKYATHLPSGHLHVSSSGYATRDEAIAAAESNRFRTAVKRERARLKRGLTSDELAALR